MEIRYEKHWSGWLNRDMEFKIYGSCGKPVIFLQNGGLLGAMDRVRQVHGLLH